MPSQSFLEPVCPLSVPCFGRSQERFQEGAKLDAIRSIVAQTVTLPLPEPLQIGPMTVTERRYAVVRVTTAGGLVGSAYAQTRGAPVVPIIDDLLTPVLIGADAGAIEDRWRDCYRATIAVGRVGLVMRAVSLLDIALWDVAGQRAGVPLYRLLGADRDRVEVMLVAGYPRTEEDISIVVAAAREAAERSHRMIKIARAPDPSITAQVLDAFDAELPDGTRFVVDGSWVWDDPTDPLAEISNWPAHRMAWLEDPFAPEDIETYREMRNSSPIPIAVGEELTDPRVHRALLAAGAVDVLRVDVSTLGITGAQRVISYAAEAGVPVSFHIYPEISAHVAAAWPICHDIETFDRTGNPYDPSHELIEGGPVFVDGVAILPDEPGLGLSIHC
jgi:L-alanine-DL-glutamate epimerase-like enolase superfamily enzyme